MEAIKINLLSPVNGEKYVNIVDMIETKDELLIKLDNFHSNVLSIILKIIIG